ncbi:MAG: hypothetical protein ACOC7K_00040 [bacterium]
MLDLDTKRPFAAVFEALRQLLEGAQVSDWGGGKYPLSDPARF